MKHKFTLQFILMAVFWGLFINTVIIIIVSISGTVMFLIMRTKAE